MSYAQNLVEEFKKLFSSGGSSVQNKTTSYVLPMLGNSAKEFWSKDFPQSNFRSAFIGDRTHDSFEEHKILLLYKFSGRENYIKFEALLQQHDDFVGTYEPDNHHVMYIFNIPDKWKSDFNKFLKWKPSEFSNKYKQHIQKFYNLEVNSPIYGVLYKTEERFRELEKSLQLVIPRELEASSSPYWEIEYYDESFRQVKKIDKIVNESRKNV